MRQTQTAVLERGARFAGSLATEPFEVAWAGEARWFVQFLEPVGAEVELQVQISPDGLTWTDHETPPRTVSGTDTVTVPVTHFGSWLRLVLRGPQTDDPRGLIRVYLTLKE